LILRLAEFNEELPDVWLSVDGFSGPERDAAPPKRESDPRGASWIYEAVIGAAAFVPEATGEAATKHKVDVRLRDKSAGKLLGGT
jgi:hypothetical protein